MSAKAFFKSGDLDKTRILYRRAETDLPDEFIRMYKKNVVSITPKKSGALRRSIITQSTGNRAEIAWRLPYAIPQDEGGHTVTERRKVRIGDRWVTLAPGKYRYHRYTTPGTGPGFATKAFIATNEQMPEAYRRLGLTK